MKTINLHYFDEKNHRYKIWIPSVTKICSVFFNKKISDKLKKMPHFIQATKRGILVHGLIGNYLNKFPYEGEFFKDNKIDEMLLNFINWSEQNNLLENNKTGHSEYDLVGSIIDEDHCQQLIIGGTIDYLNTNLFTLYEWKTTSTSNNLPLWKLQTRLYCHLYNQEMGANILKNIVIYNLATNEEFKFKFKPLTNDEITKILSFIHVLNLK